MINVLFRVGGVSRTFLFNNTLAGNEGKFCRLACSILTEQYFTLLFDHVSIAAGKKNGLFFLEHN